jgi:hypothetical protein
VLRLFRTYGHVDVDRLGEEPASLRSGQEAER